MKLSEAMMLGYTLVKFDPHLYLSCGRGCLSGAALKAATGANYGMSEDIIKQWPWLMNRKFADPVHEGWWSFAIYIVDAMAFEVERGAWTIEQAADWIRSVEPSEPAETLSAPHEIRPVENRAECLVSK
jgi:hypothetical protein